MKDQHRVTSGDLIAKTTKRTTQTIPAGSLRVMADFFMGYISCDRASLLNEIVEFHCYNVNPRDLVVAHEFFKALNSETALKDAPLVKMYLLFTQYTSDKVRNQFNGPCISQFLEQICVSSFCKKPQLVKNWTS